MSGSDQEPADAALVRAVLDGAAEAFEVLVRRYARAAYVVALATTGVPADAEDAVQDALIQAHQRLPECRRPERFGAWLLRIVRNRAHNVRRHEQLRRGQPLGAGGVEAAIEARSAGSDMPQLGNTRPDGPDVRLERGELRGHLLQALAQEPEVRRQVLLLHDLEGWKHREIAEALGISALMSRHHLSAVRRSMRRRLAHHRLTMEDR